MSQEPLIEKQPAPYAPPANVLALIHRFRDRDLPDEPFTPKFLEETGIPAGNVHRTLRALEFLGLLDGAGAPTNSWQHLRIATDEEFPARLEAVVRNAYVDVFKRVDPTKDSQTMIEGAFRRYAPAAQRGRMVTLFLSLCREAGIQTLDTPRRRETKVPIASATRGRPPARLAPMAERAPVGVSVAADQHPLIVGLLRTLPIDGSGWTTNERDQWLKAAEAVLNLLYPVTTGE